MGNDLGENIELRFQIPAPAFGGQNLTPGIIMVLKFWRMVTIARFQELPSNPTSGLLDRVAFQTEFQQMKVHNMAYANQTCSSNLELSHLSTVTFSIVEFTTIL